MVLTPPVRLVRRQSRIIELERQPEDLRALNILEKKGLSSNEAMSRQGYF